VEKVGMLSGNAGYLPIGPHKGLVLCRKPGWRLGLA
jgi:hypothetical protein